ncbi:GTP 3',8-cyclase MoaA [uncultured Aquitalea sp.]|uniref:GTP 3',8-cyclase MoaA n=1 Tax=uncultured Aquitalea sp. TaxID=540272 RepID=UPI0025F1F50D|nr:GTP 3',8-cyclase MoaA [uncultured Aquitalea sp.]
MLTDRFGRTIDYLRVSVTDRCDLRCTYCIPKGFKGFEEPANWLTHDELVRVVAAFARLGTRRFRLTGGEPLLRRGLVGLAGRLSALPGVEDLSLTTNGTQLTRMAHDLRAAGVSRLNLSLDSLQRDCLHTITGSDSLPAIMDGLMAAKQAGFTPIKINMVVMKGVNEAEISPMVAFCIKHGFVLRLIEAMPMGDTGRNAHYMDLQPVLERLRSEFSLRPQAATLGGGPARYWTDANGRFSLGLITPISQHFCATCNRVRLSVDGTLYLCLGQEQQLPLREPLRAGIDDAGLEALIREAVELKPERHEFIEKPGKVVRFMSMTGG